MVHLITIKNNKTELMYVRGLKNSEEKNCAYQFIRATQEFLVKQTQINMNY